jgi:hypothetical protein
LTIQARLAAQGRPKPESIERLLVALAQWSAEHRVVTPSILALSAQTTTAAARAVLGVFAERGIVARDGDSHRLAVSPGELLAVGKDLARRFETLRREDHGRLEAVRAYAQALECRSAVVRRYFGERDPPSCGTCDVCTRARESRPFSPAAGQPCT